MSVPYPSISHSGFTSGYESGELLWCPREVVDFAPTVMNRGRRSTRLKKFWSRLKNIILGTRNLYLYK